MGWWRWQWGARDPSGAVGCGLSSLLFKKCVCFAVSLVFCMYEMAASGSWLDLSCVVSISHWSTVESVGGERGGSRAVPKFSPASNPA